MDNQNYNPNNPISDRPTPTPAPAQTYQPQSSFEQQFLNSVQTSAEAVAPVPELKTPKTIRSKVALIICLVLSLGALAGGIFASINPDFFPSLVRNNQATADVAALQDEVDKLRATESETLAATGFSAKYYAALANSSALVNEQYALEDAAAAPDSDANFFGSGALYFFAGTALLLSLGIFLFIKL